MYMRKWSWVTQVPSGYKWRRKFAASKEKARMRKWPSGLDLTAVVYSDGGDQVRMCIVVNSKSLYPGVTYSGSVWVKSMNLVLHSFAQKILQRNTWG